MVGYGVSQIGKSRYYLLVCLSVYRSVGRSVGRSESIIRKQSVRKKEKNVFPVTGRLVISM